jgi:hypothetical protein
MALPPLVGAIDAISAKLAVMLAKQMQVGM